MEDNARPHTAAKTQEYLENKGNHKIDWPPQSPDLNPIENVCLHMKREIARQKKQFKSVDEVMATIHYVWDKISCDVISNLYKSMSERLRDVIKIRGYRSKF